MNSQSIASLVDSTVSVWEVGGCWEMLLNGGGEWVVLIRVPGEPRERRRLPHSVCTFIPAREGGLTREQQSPLLGGRCVLLESRVVTHQTATARYKYPLRHLSPDSILAQVAPHNSIIN